MNDQARALLRIIRLVEPGARQAMLSPDHAGMVMLNGERRPDDHRLALLTYEGDTIATGVGELDTFEAAALLVVARAVKSERDARNRLDTIEAALSVLRTPAP